MSSRPAHIVSDLESSILPPRTANDRLAPFVHNLSEYRLVLHNFWNNANRHVVPDPFGIVT